MVDARGEQRSPCDTSEALNLKEEELLTSRLDAWSWGETALWWVESHALQPKLCSQWSQQRCTRQQQG